MSVEEGVAYLQKNGSAIRSKCTSATIPEILAICREKGLLSLEEKEICDNSNLTNAGKWDRISDMLQTKREITLDGVWEIFSGESSKHILTYLRSVHTEMDHPAGGNSSDNEVSGNAARGIRESQELIPNKNVSGIEIVQSEYILNEENLKAILNFAKDNYTVKDLKCVNISTCLVPQILNKFKLIEILKFWHERSLSGYCLCFGSRSDGKKEEDCLFKIEDLAGCRNLKNLELRRIQVVFSETFPNLPGLKKLFLDNCDISGDFIDFISRGNLEDLILSGITPMLAKEDVEKLLMTKTLKFIGLGKHHREIFTSSFIPIGPDGRSMEKINPNSKIVFARESFGQPWGQATKFLDIVDSIFKLTQDNVDLVLNSTNENITVVWLTCSNISTRRIPDIQKKIKNISRLEFWHNMYEEGNCSISEAPKKSLFSFFERKKDAFLQPDACLLKMIDFKGFEKLRHLCLENLEVEFNQNFSISEYLPKLRIFEIIFCSLIGNFMDALTSPSNLEDLRLRGITPPLTKGDVGGLLRSKSLNYIQLSKHKREVFTGSFTPIGPDGNPMREITQNSKIVFKRATFGKPWAQNSEPVEIGESHLNNRNIESILNSPFENTKATKLYCTEIPTMKIPAILNKFKSIQKLIFHHEINENYKCAYLGSISKARREAICLFKMADLVGFSHLKILKLISLDVSFPRTFLNLPGLKELLIQHCSISGDFINEFIWVSNLEDVGFWGNTPCLTKEDVEKLLRSKSLKIIELGKYGREIFASSFIPIGPDGNTMKEITQNAKIKFIRESVDKSWVQKIEKNNE